MASAVVASSLQNGPAPGQRFVDSIDPDDPERTKELMKPAEVREDMKQMEARARVSQILNSQAFREQLEEIIETQTDPASLLMDLKSGPHLGSWVVPQQLFQLVLPTASPSTNSLQSTLLAGRGPITPVADVRGVNSALYTKGERALRCKVASTCRLLDLFGWVHGMQGSMTARVNESHFLANPLGLMYGEMTAGSLVKVDAAGSIIDSGNTYMGTRTDNLALQLALYAAKPDVGCILHLLTSSALAISLAKCGLLPVSQEAMVVGDPAYFNSDALATGVVDQDLAQLKNRVIFVRNHGMMVLGRTVEEVTMTCYSAVLACDTQVRVMPLGIDNVILPTESARQQASYVGGLGSEGVDTIGARYAGTGHRWQAGELEFEAWMRLLDSAGYRTGYVYRQTSLQSENAAATRSEEESVAATLVLKYYEDTDKQSAARKEAQSKQRRQQKVHWLATGQGKTSGGNPVTASPQHAQDQQATVRPADNGAEESPAQATTGSNVSTAAAAEGIESSRRTSESLRAKDAEQPVPKARSSTTRPKSEDASKAYERAAAGGLIRTASDGLQPHSPSYLSPASSNGGSKPGGIAVPIASDKSPPPPSEADEKKKKKSKFRIPSFSKSKQDRKEKAKSAALS